MKFRNADSVRDIVGYMRQTDIRAHSFNRAKIMELFEGFPPYSEEEQEINRQDTNCNFLEAPGLAQKARSTWNNAFLKPGNYFTVTLDAGPKHKRGTWSHTITKHMQKVMKDSLSYVETVRATGAQVVMHGIGPKWWERSNCWRPDEIGIEDLLVPSGTRVKLNNLSHFAIFRKYTPEELFRMTHGKRVDEGWDMGMVEAEMKRVTETLMQNQRSYTDYMNPEKLVKFYKANSGYLDSDAVATVNVWDFYYQEDDEDDSRWYRKMILDDSLYGGQGFLYNPKRAFAGDLSQILHIQFGDGANTAPFLYHTVRSLGFLLFGVCQLQNRIRCGFMDAIMRATHEYFRVRGGDERARIQKADLVNLGIVPDGLEFVPREQRWQVDEALIVAGLSQNRQLMSENASAFVQDVDSGTAKELTATEVMARLNNANALVSSLLSMAYTYAKFEYREIARRFTIKDSGDKDIEQFRMRCLRDGVPPEYLNVKAWDIDPERVMGGGNKTLELAQAKSMMEIRSQMDSAAQRDVLRDYILAVTDDPDKAERWVPETQSISSSEHDAQLAIGSLMQLAPVGVMSGMDNIGYVEAMLLSMKSIMDDIAIIGQPTPQQVVGLLGVFKHLQEHIQIIAQDEMNAARVRRYGEFLKPIMNQVKAWSARMGQEAKAAQAQQQNGEMAKVQADVQAKMLGAQTKSKIDTMSAAAKQKRLDMAFSKEQQRKDAAAQGEHLRKNVDTTVDVAHQQTLTDAKVESTDKLTAAQIRKQRMTFEASNEE